MDIEDINHIFKPQLTEGTTMLYFMLEENSISTIQRHCIFDMESLVEMLDCFTYNGSLARIPRFTK